MNYLKKPMQSKSSKYLFAAARFVREKSYGHNVFLRGLIEFTNYCKNDCYYCGIRCSNHKATRYRLSLEEILLSCEIGYKIIFAPSSYKEAKICIFLMIK